MTAAQQIPLISVEEYLAAELDADVRHEYLGGYLYAMAGAKTSHNRISSAFNGILFGALRGKPCEAFNSDMKVRVPFQTHTRFYYPDGMVVCQPNDAEATYQDQPVVIAEVLSESTRRVDEGEKREAYLTIPSLCAYLLIEQDAPRVSVYRRAEQGFTAELYEGLEAVIELAVVEAELPLAELYERVDFSHGQ